MFEKRNINVTNNEMTKKATVGIVDFQDSQYKQYLMNKEVKR
jgi:aminoglycoside/choline kinase family phosphotransferase